MIGNSKYRNKKTVVDNIVFDSKLEAERYGILKLLEKAGEIKDLEMQVEFVLIPPFTHNGKKYRKATYKADFVYTDKEGKQIVEDTKGFVTKEYALKKKLLLFRYPDIDFREVYRKGKKNG